MHLQTLTQYGNQTPHYAPCQVGLRRYPTNSTSGASSRGSVDSVLIEEFPDSDSSSTSCERESQSAPSVPEPTAGPPKVHSRGLKNMVSRKILKKQVQKLLATLISTNDGASCSVPDRQRHEAAASLMKIVDENKEGADIVALRFVERDLRREEVTRALLKLSDDELDIARFRLLDPIPQKPTSIRLLELVMRYTSDSLFFQKLISSAMKDGNRGALIILHLATQEEVGFFFRINYQLILDFGNRIIGAEESLSPRWYCGLKLLCKLFEAAAPSEWRELELLPPLLSTLFEGFVKHRQILSQTDMDENARSESNFHNSQLMPRIAKCCDKIASKFDPIVLLPPETVKPFIELLVHLVHPDEIGLRYLGHERGLALWTLISLLKFPTIVGLIPNEKLSSISTFFMDTALHSWTPNFQEAGVSEKSLLRPLKSWMDYWGIFGLCCLPESTFNNTLTTILEDSTLELENPNTNPYEPLGLVERLLWLSNIPIIDAEVHRALVKGGACEFLVYVLSHSRTPDPQDRGVWRAKGLAMTCLGNIVQRMDKDQFSLHITKAMIDGVVTIKEHGDVPEVQRGQAILLLKRCTLAADRWGVPLHYREDTSDLPEELRNRDANNSRST